MSLAILFYFLCTQHVSDINIAIIRSLRLCCWITISVVLFLVRCVLEIWCGCVWVGLPCQYFTLLMKGAWRPKHVEKVCSNKICILLHHVGVLFNLVLWCTETQNWNLYKDKLQNCSRNQFHCIGPCCRLKPATRTYTVKLVAGTIL